MSAEIAAFNDKDSAIVAQATLTAAAIQVETGATPSTAYNNRGAEYAVKLTITALREMGIVVGDIDERDFADRVTRIEHQTLPAREWRQ